MRTIKNLLAAIGLAVVAVGLFGLAQSSGIIGQLDLSNAVVRQQPQQQPVTVYVVATPTAEAVQPAQVVTAVPVISNEVQPVQPAPVVPSAPTPIAADDFAQACAAGQAAGRRVSPNCPPRAGQPLTVTNGPRLTYCFQGDGWTPEYRQTVSDGFAAWAATGITFAEDDVDCQTAIVLTTDTSDHAGHGGMGLIDFNLTYGLLPQAAVHEVGHILGLLDSNAGAMNGTYMMGAPVAYPTADEITAVRNLWGIK